jgi:hypothetical protein
LTSWNVFSHHFFGFFDFWPLNLLKRLFSSFFRHKRNKRMGRDGRVGYGVDQKKISTESCDGVLNPKQENGPRWASGLRRR